MDINKAIETRRSTRYFLDKDVNWNKLGDILDSARYAPSSGNLQNWRFIVVKDKEKKEKLAVAAADQTFIEKAPAIIVVCSDDADVKIMYKSKSDHYSTQNCAAAIQNMLLKATSLGIASCWIGAFREEKIKAILKIPDKIKVHAMIALGYAKREEKMPKRIDLENLVYFDEWKNKEKN